MVRQKHHEKKDSFVNLRVLSGSSFSRHSLRNAAIGSIRAARRAGK